MISNRLPLIIAAIILGFIVYFTLDYWSDTRNVDSTYEHNLIIDNSLVQRNAKLAEIITNNSDYNCDDSQCYIRKSKHDDFKLFIYDDRSSKIHLDNKLITSETTDDNDENLIDMCSANECRYVIEQVNNDKYLHISAESSL